MGLLKHQTFVCLDCETTGLDLKDDRIIEVAAVRFTFEMEKARFERLVDPERKISEESMKIHHISDEMVQGKPLIKEILPKLLDFVGRDMVVGHGVGFDLEMIVNAAKREKMDCTLLARPFVDTLRLARLYGQSPSNSLIQLADHFNVPHEDQHRAMGDVEANIAVFKHLARSFKTTEQLMKALDKPILMKKMPLGKHKGRPLSEIPLDYLLWAAGMKFDRDLLFSIRSELKRRKKGTGFAQVNNPFKEL